MGDESTGSARLGVGVVDIAAGREFWGSLDAHFGGLLCGERARGGSRLVLILRYVLGDDVGVDLMGWKDS